METKYIVMSEGGIHPRSQFSTDKKKAALQTYSQLCEEYPKTKFWVVKRQTIEETIAESDDYRQTKFSF